ncbi:MAG: DNA mismatch repair protein MutS, partial [Candidatus Eremiobacteraeota bacterium]|nr:DNA mismatch repair protein MutS [Candidatus Eremiobacteraeota bacterium]
MLEQYFGMKNKHPEAVLLSRVGDFYEAYGEDAEIVARALQIALTSNEACGGRRVAMAGVPHHALAQYLARLVAQRFIVALAEQLEVPQPNKLVRRDVVRLVTPGTLIEENLLDGKENNYLAAVAAVEGTLALAHADVSTGFCAATALAGENAYEELLAELNRIAPAEIVADVPADLRAMIAPAVEALGARLASPALGIVAQRPREVLEGFSHDESLAVHRAVDALAAFVARTGVAHAPHGREAVETLEKPQLYRHQTFMWLDAATRKNLELVRAQGQNPRATLLATLDRCATPMGSRLLARWIVAPLIDRAAIGRRQDGVELLVREHARRDAVRDLLKSCFDIERIAQKVRFRRATPRDLASLRRTLEALEPLERVVPAGLGDLLNRIADFRALLDDLKRTLVDEPPAQVGDSGAIRPDADG